MIRSLTLILSVLLVATKLSFASVDFDTYFEHKTLRVDYLLGGNANEQTVFLQNLKKESHWGGSTKNLVDSFNYGNFRYKLIDKTSGILIYSRGFGSLFQEWQSTPEAKTLNRSYYQVNVMPFPKNKVQFIIDYRNRDGVFVQLFEYEIDPTNYFILDETAIKVEHSKILGHGNNDSSIDVAFIAEGYTQEEMGKFRADVERVAGYILNVEPFKTYADRFNIYALESISEESGPDIPGKHIYKNTVLNSNFYTFDSERYLTTSDLKSMYDIAANVPYDQIFVLINTEKYGGAGIYNYYTSCASDHKLSREVASHEFGHGFVGLADEYYTSGVSVEDFYNLKVEPWEPNITTLVDFESKWKSMIEEGLVTPTPRTKDYEDKVGLFEGGGYMSKGIYSPVQDCKMKSNNKDEFCPVCQKACERMIKFIIGE
ncbi:peptidase [Ancylomarina euxinus]|uniref:Peptidase n=1 Tax=Ancylomarina euxinus TaxID=2283627 RepID=A0A425Y5I9_9BACT|nr:M64 family metallopeptidase [Ancylomarina euxinus]MCZ4694206.1 M64 family metallo-endopeptidase [Ancylomarina euxinus]MUP14463.1 peptidase [Ancylomarina euxinus]RRG23766.1 peptidase [Ancylomarina euxinus]